jgi:hypothetical protein
MKTAEMQELNDQAIRAQLERLVRSDALKRSRRLQQFLRYVTEMTLAGDASKINEYLLGVEVFERGPDYNAADDSIVRRQAHALRHKLAEYYAAEGKHDPVRIEIPLGHYVPSFEVNPEAAEADDAEAAPEQPVAPKRTASRAVILGVAFGALALGLSFWLGRVSAPQQPIAAPARAAATPALRELWGPWLSSSQGPTIVFSSPLGAVVKHFPEPLAPNSAPPRFPVPASFDAEFRNLLKLGSGGHLYLSPTLSDTKAGEAVGAVQLAALFASRGLPIRGTTAALLDWENFRQSNLILLGHNEQNSWMDPLLKDYPLQLKATEPTAQRRIVNTAPRPGEPAYYQIDYPSNEDESTIEHALVSMLPGTDGLHQLLLVSGLNTQATLMAIEFLTAEERAKQLIGRLREEDPNHEGPWHFQVVLSADVRERVATGGSIEQVRIVGPRHALSPSTEMRPNQ